jgi:hypothetical protein
MKSKKNKNIIYSLIVILSVLLLIYILFVYMDSCEGLEDTSKCFIKKNTLFYLKIQDISGNNKLYLDNSNNIIKTNVKLYSSFYINKCINKGGNIFLRYSPTSNMNAASYIKVDNELKYSPSSIETIPGIIFIKPLNNTTNVKVGMSLNNTYYWLTLNKVNNIWGWNTNMKNSNTFNINYITNNNKI